MEEETRAGLNKEVRILRKDITALENYSFLKKKKLNMCYEKVEEEF
jgi:hypothetical protein